ncbi:MAG: hypothetical protein ABIB47_03395 [Candidatus Woesearchaeota archaeon]
MVFGPIDILGKTAVDEEVGCFGGRDISDALLYEVIERHYDDMNPVQRETFLSSIGIETEDKPGFRVDRLLEGCGIDVDFIAEQYRAVVWEKGSGENV